MQRIVFINLHANEFLLKPLNKYIWKQSCAFKHKYFLEYLLQNSDIEVCNYINEDGFTLVKSFPKPVMWFLDKLRFVESSITMRKNELNHKGIITLKSVSEIRPDDIVIGYRHVPSSLMDMDQIHAFKIVHMIHFHGQQEDSDLIKRANPDYLVNECDLSRTSEIFRRYYGWFKKQFIVHPFVAAARFQRNKPFAERECRCFSTGTITYKLHPEFLKVYGDPCDQPARKQILTHAKELEPWCVCYNSDYLEDTDMKKYLPTDNIFQHYNKVWYNMRHTGQQKKYFSFNMVDKFNDFKMCLVGEEILGVPGIGFVEGMCCGCAYIGQKIGYYEDLGMQEGIHYIGYDGTLDDLKAKISYYQQPDHQDELERIADNGYQFAQTHFRGNQVAEQLLNKLIQAQKEWKLSK